MNKKQRLELAEWSVAQARKGGADDVAVNVGNSRDIEIQFREGNLEKLQESTQNYLSLSIYASMRYSSHSTNDIRKESLKGFIEEAIDMTKYLNEDPFRSLPDPKYYKDQKEMDLKIKDIDYDKVTSDSRVSMAREIEKIAMAQSDKIISCTSYYADNYYESVKVHSNGFKGENEGTSFSAGVAVTVKDEKGRPQDYDWRTVRFHKELPAPEVYAKSAVQRTLNQIGQVKLKSGLYDMVIENRENWRIFYSLLEPLTGQALQQKNSFLEGKLGQKIASEKFTIIDDPFIQSGLSSILYDGEGMAARKRVIVDKGVLKSYYIDTYYGKKLGVEPTTGSPSNIMMDYGSKTLEEMIKGINKGILVTSFVGGNSNSTTGDFSFGVIGQYIENGQIIKPIHEMNIYGNFTDLLNQLVEVGNDPYMFSSLRLPSLHFKDVQFSGI